MATEFYLNASTARMVVGRPDTPCYDRWYRWTKFGLNIGTTVLGAGLFITSGGDLADSDSVVGLFAFIVALRIIEVIADTVPLVRRRKDPTALQEGYVNVLWFTSCCTRHEKAEKVDKWLKYFSSVVLSLTLTILCFCTFGHKFRIGALVLAFVAGADFGVGSYCLVVDEIVKDRRLVRTKPYQMELDDALALTDDDALARDMFARSSQNDGKSYYMSEASSSPHATASIHLHDVKVEGQWRRVKEDIYSPVSVSALPSGPYGQTR